MSCETILMHSYVPKEVADKKLKERRINLLILIQHFLKTEGYIETYEKLRDESKLSQEFDLCDNIDLNNILQDYETYYYIRFQKYPKISKKVTKNITGVKKIKNKIKNITKQESKIMISNDESLANLNLEGSIYVHPLCDSSGDYLEGKLFKPLGSYEGYCDEWKSLAEIIVKEVVQKDLNVKWDDIKGLDSAKMILKEAVVFPVKYSQLFEGILKPWKGLLLYGPSGNGKTLLAKAVAAQCNSTFFNISASSIVSKWRGDSEKLVRVMFELARHEAPSTIFIDELDALASRRDSSHEHEASRRLKSELLVQLDGLCQSNDNVFFLAATNLPWDLDPALLRRLEKKIFIGLPDTNARAEIFRMYLPTLILRQPELRVDLDYQNLAKETEGYSGADLRLASKEAVMRSVRALFLNLENKKVVGNMLNSAKLRTITEKDVFAALNEVRPSEICVQQYKEWSSNECRIE